MKIKGNDIIIGLFVAFIIWIAYLIFILKFNPQKAFNAVIKDIGNFFNNAAKKIQELIKNINRDIQSGFLPGANNLNTGSKNSSGLLIGGIKEDVYK